MLSATGSTSLRATWWIPASENTGVRSVNCACSVEPLKAESELWPAETIFVTALSSRPPRKAWSSRRGSRGPAPWRRDHGYRGPVDKRAFRGGRLLPNALTNFISAGQSSLSALSGSTEHSCLRSGPQKGTKRKSTTSPARNVLPVAEGTNLVP